MFDLSFPFALYFTFFLFLFMLVKHLRKPSTKLPPGPWSLPIIGDLHHLISPLQPYHTLMNLSKKHGPIMHLKLGQGSRIIISSSSVAEAVLRTNEINFAQRPSILFADIIEYGGVGLSFAPYGNFWRQIRKFCMMELLSNTRVQSFRSMREEEVRNLIKSISSSNNPVINLSERFLTLTYNILSRAAFGGECEYVDEFVGLMKVISEMGAGFGLLQLFPFLRSIPFVSPRRLEKVFMKMDKVLDNIVNEHKVKRMVNNNKEKDLVDGLLKQLESNDVDFTITTTNIKAIIMDMYSASTDTAASTMGWAMSEMLRNPKIMQKAQDEVRQVFTKKQNISEEDLKDIHYLKLVIKETLRLHPPVPLMIRECTENCKIYGYDIPTKSRVVVNLWAIGRDPAHWSDNADCFIPERFEESTIDYNGFNFEYIPFGSGRRICPGISFAMANIEFSLALLLFHFDWKLPNCVEPEKLDMSEAFGLTITMKNDLNVIAIPFSCT